MSSTKSGKKPILYHSSFLCVLHFNVVFLLCRSSPLIFDVCPLVFSCNPDLFFSQSIYEFRTAVYYSFFYLFCTLLPIVMIEFISVRPWFSELHFVDLFRLFVCLGVTLRRISRCGLSSIYDCVCSWKSFPLFCNYLSHEIQITKFIEIK